MKQRAIAHTPLADLDSLGAQVYREELTPLAFLERSGSVHADRIAVVDGNRRYTYRDWRVRARQFASALRKAGMRKGDRIAFLALNSEQLLLAHFAVPMAGGVLVAINTRLSAAEVAYIVAHSGARRIFYSCELQPLLADLPGQVTPCDIGSGFEGFLATGNAGCHMQIAAGARLKGVKLRVRHPVELLDESYRRAGYYDGE